MFLKGYPVSCCFCTILLFIWKKFIIIFECSGQDFTISLIAGDLFRIENKLDLIFKFTTAGVHEPFFMGYPL